MLINKKDADINFMSQLVEEIGDLESKEKKRTDRLTKIAKDKADMHIEILK